jgi:hypothetical protein
VEVRETAQGGRQACQRAAAPHIPVQHCGDETLDSRQHDSAKLKASPNLYSPHCVTCMKCRRDLLRHLLPRQLQHKW